MINFDIQTTYKALKKIVLSDYPYEIEWDDLTLFDSFKIVYENIIEEHSHIDERYYSLNGKGILKLNYIDHQIILEYKFANYLYKNGLENIAEAVYYSLRMRGCIDLFYTTEIGRCFIPTHPIGSVMDSHAKYGNFFSIYNGVHIGPYDIVGKKPADWKHPIFGDHVTLLANSCIYGSTTIGNNVIVSAGTVVVNEEIPDNCIVIGTSPNLYFMPLKTKLYQDLKK